MRLRCDRSIHPEFTFQSAGDERVIAFDHFVQLDRTNPVAVPNSARTALVAILANGDRIAGTPIKLQGDSLLWRSVSLSQSTLPMRQVVSIRRASQNVAEPPATRTEDIVTLANGDTLRGIVSDLTDTNLAIQITGGTDVTNVPLSTVAAVDLATTASPSTAPTEFQPLFRLSLADGTIVSADSISLAADKVKFKTADTVDHAIPLATLTDVEQINGPLIWLSACPIAQEIQTPYFGDRTQLAQMDKTVQGDPIRSGDREFARGIGVHSYSKLVFSIPPGCQSFRTQYALDGDATWAHVTVRVKLDDRVVHEKANVIAGQLSPVVTLDLTGAKTLTLEVDYGENYDVQDRLNWIEPAFLRAAAPTAAAPAPAIPTAPALSASAPTTAGSTQ